MEEVFEKLLEDSEVWYAERVPHEKQKCNLCNEERKLVAVYPDGETVTKKCNVLAQHIFTSQSFH